MRYCDHCGNIPDEGARFCSLCGNRLKKAKASADPGAKVGKKAFFLAMAVFILFLAVIIMGISSIAASFGI